MLDDCDLVQDWKLAQLFCCINSFLTKSKQHIFATNTCSRTVLLFGEKLNFKLSPSEILSHHQVLPLFWWCERLKKKKNPRKHEKHWKKRKSFRSSSTATKAHLIKKRKTHNNTQNWKMSSTVLFLKIHKDHFTEF